MKVITTVEKSPKLLLYESLNLRKKLPTKEKNTYSNLLKGYEGELLFSKYTAAIEGKGIIFNDLLLETNQTTFQIDTLIINQAKIYLYEVKNFEGDFYLEADKFFKRPQQEFVNPLHQLSRAQSLLRQLLLSLGFNTPIDASVVFVNPNFTLYQAPLEAPIIFPSQIKRQLNMVGQQSTKLTDSMKRLTAKLLEARKTDYPYQLPEYDYAELKKGIVCPDCGMISIILKKRTCVCKICGYMESVDDAILRSVQDFRLLFPERKVTTSEIYEWCGGILSEKVIRTTLSRKFEAVGLNRWTYYK